jgi:hypothetical protein
MLYSWEVQNVNPNPVIHFHSVSTMRIVSLKELGDIMLAVAKMIEEGKLPIK